MRTTLRLTSFATLLLAASLTFAQPAPDEARDLLNKAIKAHGGEAALVKYQAGRTRGKGTIDIAGQVVPFTQETAYQSPNKYRDELELDLVGQKIKVLTLFDGKRGAIYVDGKALPASDAIKTALKDASEMLQSARLVSLSKDKAAELSLMGESTVNDRPVLGLRVVRKGSRDVSLYFDKKTGLLAKIEARTVDPTTEQELTEERIITAYQKVDDVSVVKSVLLQRDGKKFLESEVQDVKLLEQIGDDEFALPKE